MAEKGRLTFADSSSAASAAELAFARALSAEPQNATLQKAIEAARAHTTNPHARGAGAVYSWGKGEFGALGHGDCKDRTLPRVVDALRGRRVVDRDGARRRVPPAEQPRPPHAERVERAPERARVAAVGVRVDAARHAED